MDWYRESPSKRHNSLAKSKIKKYVAFERPYGMIIGWMRLNNGSPAPCCALIKDTVHFIKKFTFRTIVRS